MALQRSQARQVVSTSCKKVYAVAPFEDLNSNFNKLNRESCFLELNRHIRLSYLEWN